MCEHEVDLETGVVRIIKFTDAHDSGTVINPIAFHGQIEGSMVPVFGSIANAIYDAVGVRMTELPITPQKILKALEEKKSSG